MQVFTHTQKINIVFFFFFSIRLSAINQKNTSKLGFLIIFISVRLKHVKPNVSKRFKVFYDYSFSLPKS